MKIGSAHFVLKIKLKRNNLRWFFYFPTNNVINNVPTVTEPITAATRPLLFLLEPSSITLTQKM